MSDGNGRDPLLADDWVTDPWDDPASLPDDALEGEPPAFEQAKGPVRSLLIVLIVTVLLTGAAGLWVVNQLNPSGDPGAAVNFTVREVDTLDDMVGRLHDEGIIGNRPLFSWYARLRGGLQPLPGYYSLKPGDSAGNIVDALSTPPAQTFSNVTFPEGFTVAQMAARLSEKVTFFSAADFLAAATGGSVVSGLAPPGTSSLEGLLFPDTYQVSGDDTESRVVARLASMMERVTRQENLADGAKTLGYLPYEVLIVASLIEREAKVDADRPKIAQVIYNRLARSGSARMKLEIDATFLYGADPNASFAELKEADSPYNTYRKFGLPPTPIANPGRASIRAALAPAGNPPKDDEACTGLARNVKCEYLYYVLSDAEGGHTFATTYEQHLVNVETSRAAGLLP